MSQTPALDVSIFKNNNVPGLVIDEYNDTFSALTLRLIPEYPFYFPHIKFFKDDRDYKLYSQMKDELKKLIPDIHIDEFHTINKFTIIKCDLFVILLSSNDNDTSMIGNIYIKDILNEKTKELDILLKKYISPDIFGIGDVDYFYYKKAEVVKKTFYKYSSDFSYIMPELYPGINIGKLVDAFTESNENILILTGAPGVGKTTLVKYLITHFIEKNGVKDEDDVTIAYCKDEKMVEDDEFWVELNSDEYNLLILDDFDNGLAPRTHEQKDNSFVSKLLSFSDGVMDNKVKVIITTNRDLDEIDTAIMRPGRCFDILKLRSLTVEEAKNLWVKVLSLSEELFEQQFGDKFEFITQSHLMSVAHMINKKQDRSYLEDKTISVKEDFIDGRIKRKVGFNTD